MPRTKGSKNRPKTTHIDYASQIAEKQDSIVSLTAEIASITANIDTLKADLKEKKTAEQPSAKKQSQPFLFVQKKKPKEKGKKQSHACQGENPERNGAGNRRHILHTGKEAQSA